MDSLVLDSRTQATAELVLRIVDPKGSIVWPATETRPELHFRPRKLDIGQNGVVNIEASEAAVLDAPPTEQWPPLKEGDEVRLRNSSHVMIKIVGFNADDKVVVPIWFNKLARPDDVEPTRPDGRQLYSLPQHALQSGKKNFLFVASIVRAKDSENVDITLHQVSLRRDTATGYKFTSQKVFGRENVEIPRIEEILKRNAQERLAPAVQEAANRLVS
jgi:hypothetical protein